jgi:hypothetical protein
MADRPPDFTEGQLFVGSLLCFAGMALALGAFLARVLN